MRPEFTPERPLSPAAKALIIAGAAGTSLLFYLFVALALLVLLAIIGAELLLAVALLRFGLIRVVTGLLDSHVRLAGTFFRSLLPRRKQAEFRVGLKSADAPGLFTVLERLCQRMEVAMPDEVSLEMNLNAWVRLKGYRRGTGKTVLGVGYDLLAGLSETQVEAVLAHELAHAKLIQRGVRHWLAAALQRNVWLATALAARLDAAHRAGRSSSFTAIFFAPADWLARLEVRLVAAYSRQEEFEADRGAAEVCGAAAMRSALLRLETVGQIVAGLPWRERVAQLQRSGGFSEWLLRELASAPAKPASEPEKAVFNKYSTHPLLRDRLAALGSADPLPDAAPGLKLLAHPDRSAEKLIAEIQRVLAEDEEKDAGELRKWSKTTRRQGNLKPLQWLGFFVGLAGFIQSFFVFFADSRWLVGFSAAACWVAGIWLYRVGGYRERRELAIPDFALLKETWPGRGKISDAAAPEQEIEQELKRLVEAEKKKRRRAELLTAESYAALAQCNYLRAHVAARLCLAARKKSVEGHLALAVACAGLRLGDPSGRALNVAQRLTGMRGRSTVWAAAWASVLLGDWTRAEAFLYQVTAERKTEPTALALLAFCQSRRGKLQSAIVNIRKACTPAPKKIAYAQLFISLLLDGGYLQEAQEQLAKVEQETADHADLMFAMVRLHLLLRDDAAAGIWSGRFREKSTEAHSLVRLGHIYEGARKHADAENLFREALAKEHFPEALFALGRLAYSRRNHAEARRHLLAALDVGKTVGKDGVGPLVLFVGILNHLVALQEPVADCQAWIAAFTASASPKALANVSLIVYAPGMSDAEKSLHELVSAMQPGAPPLLPGTVTWKVAPRQQQPVGLVRPGVQRVV